MSYDVSDASERLAQAVRRRGFIALWRSGRLVEVAARPAPEALVRVEVDSVTRSFLLWRRTSRGWRAEQRVASSVRGHRWPERLANQAVELAKEQEQR